MTEDIDKIKTIIDQAESLVILQADNPDGDSLGSALALESLLGDQGKKVSLYCAVDMPSYLRYMSGWDRVQKELPNKFDASIIVDASTMTLFERLENSGEISWLKSKPCIVLDHHQTVENPIYFSSITINDPTKSSTGELIYLLSKQLEWNISVQAQEFMMTSILGDTQGLSNQLTTAETYRVMAEMVDSGVDRPMLEELRRQYNKMPEEIFRYKADLINRTSFTANGRVAHVIIEQSEINQYSPLYNPAPLIQNDMLQTEGVKVAIVFKHYSDGRITGAIRCNPDAPVGGKIADHLGGGGHDFASGFKDVSGKDISVLVSDCLQYSEELLNNIGNNA